ncbi:Peptide/nickel transport system permease protein [Paraburkholderia unamae]|uniref:ABC transporter permease n=1 Tax=Paraburkholderia unamae TaxID=219649 RepID=UPI001CB2ABD9|nr:ABC transporter permease [Paraburkholderia unamae]CAG9271297.1 Peptide/nickel transport system permease protein [Paraburkholderia unamae]
MKRNPFLTRLLARVLVTLPVLLVCAIFTFMLVRLLPGDPAAQLASGMQSDAQGLAELRHRLGTDAPLATQLWQYLDGLVHGHWGRSFTTGRDALDELLDRLPATLELTISGFVLALASGLALGVAAACRPGSAIDRFARALSSAGSCLPTFFVALLLIYVFYFRLGWAPEPTGRLDPMLSAPPVRTGVIAFDAWLAGDPAATLDALRRLMLPAISMALFGLPPIVRITRSALLASLAADPMRTARSLALPRAKALTAYALAPAAAPIVTAAGMMFSYMLAANVVVEKIFAWPGIGAYALDALGNADYAPLQGFVLFVAIAFALLNLCIDLLVQWIDPRTRIS